MADRKHHPSRREHQSMNEEQLDVIAVGAHPDDCEIGCGGTLAKLAQQGLRVGIVDLTDGEPTPLCDDPVIRVAEADAAAKTLGVAKRIILDLPNRRLFDSFEARVELAKQFRIYRPKLVLSIGCKTPLASPDHWQAMQITDAAIFYTFPMPSRSRWNRFVVTKRNFLPASRKCLNVSNIWPNRVVCRRESKPAKF